MIQNEKIEFYPGWMGKIDHIKAEKFLLKEKAGTYLLREGDPITKSMETELKNQGHQPLRCYVLTIIEEDEVIKEFMIIKLKKGWLLYNDNPEINEDGPCFHSLQDLLTSIQEKAKYPIQA